MNYQGDWKEDTTHDFYFTTRNTSGVPTTLSGSPVLSVYKANGTTQATAGITLTADFDSVTGLNQVRIASNADAFYATGNDYSVVVTTGTVGGVSVVGEVVASFSIENRASVISSDIKEINGSTAAAANLAKAYGGTDGDGWGIVMCATTIASMTSTTQFRLTAGAATNGCYKGCTCVVINHSLPANKFHGVVASYVGSTREITLDQDTSSAGIPAAGNIVVLLARKGGVAGFSLTEKNHIKTQVGEALATETYAEPAQGVPAATASLKDKIGYMYKAWRNKKTQTATQYSLYNDDTTTVDHKATVSETSGTVTMNEVQGGP